MHRPESKPDMGFGAIRKETTNPKNGIPRWNPAQQAKRGSSNSKGEFHIQ